MNLTNLLIQKKSTLTDKWLQLVYQSYPPETAIFLKKEKDHFDNPMGSRLSQGIKGLLEAFILEMETDKVRSFLDDIIRIRALQDFTPAQALAFIFLLKTVIREELAKEIREEKGLADEVLELESRIDGLALMGFEVYTKCREKICEIRVNEVKNRVSGLLRKSGIELNSL